MVEPVTVFVLTTGSVISEHSVTTFHVEYLIVDTTVISILVSQVVQLLTEFSDKLVFLGAANSNTVALGGSHLQSNLFYLSISN